MSDMMNPQGAGSPAPAPQGAPGKSMSPFNGADAAYMKSRGQLDPNMSVKDYIEGIYGVPVDAPVSALQAAVKQKMEQGTPMGKMRATASQGPQTPPMAPGQGMGGMNAMRTSAQAPQPTPQGLEGLVSAMRK